MPVWSSNSPMKHFVLVIMILSIASSIVLTGCAQPNTPTASPLVSTATLKPRVGAFYSGEYRNLFKEYLGKSDSEVQAKLDAAWNQLFYGNDESERVYYPVGEDMAYITDIGNGDVRTEGMSYGMMITVQLNKQDQFNRLWKWAMTYMYQPDGPYQGYFAWHCTVDGKKLDANPAPDGEEWFAMSLLFASARWGNGEGILNYGEEAQKILDTMLHKAETKNNSVTNMFSLQQKQVVFVPMVGQNSGFTDPSYQLPAYYKLWSLTAGQDQEFWTQAAQTSRDFFHKAANPKTGLMPDYANFDGTPYGSGDHKDFRFDAWRTLSNVAVDYAWFAADHWQVEQSNRVLAFLTSQGINSYPNQFTLDGTPLSSDRSTGLAAMAAVAALAADPDKGKPFVQALWDTPIPQGKWRYYDGILYMLGLLHASGNFRIYASK
jgi:oligosaccharide reducing-end xylanase